MDGTMAIGHVRVMKRDKKTNEIVYDQTFKNQITNYARSQVATAWSGQPVSFPSKIAVGTGSPPNGQSSTSPTDTALWNELANTRLAVDYGTVWLSYYTQYSLTYDQSHAIGTVDPVNNPTGQIALTEAGLFDANGNLWSHVVLNGVTHDNTTTLSIQWQVLHQGN